MLRRTLCLLCLALLVPIESARAHNPLVFFPPNPERLPATKYMQLDRDQCFLEATTRFLPFSSGPPVPTIDAPAVLTGPLHGVRFEFAHPVGAGPAEGFFPPPAIMDCRLLLALDDFAAIAYQHEIREIRYNSIYRGLHLRKKGQKHAAGVAIDILGFVMADGTELSVLDDFGGHGIRSQTCGAEAPYPPAGKPTALRAVVCDTHSSGVFNLILTPHYDWRHRNHFHLELRCGIDWFLTQ